MFLHQIKETRKALKDSESGLEKMSIGHHIQDRGHVVEKKYNKRTGEKEFLQDFRNMDECMLNWSSAMTWCSNSIDVVVLSIYILLLEDYHPSLWKTPGSLSTISHPDILYNVSQYVKKQEHAEVS